MLYDILTDIIDVPTYEFVSFSKELYSFLKDKVDYHTLLCDFQLIKRLSLKFYNRLKGRFPELQEFLFTLKIDFVNRATEELQKDVREMAIEEGQSVEKEMEKL